MVARDDDQGANGQLSYVLSAGNDEGAFSLSSSGQLSLTRTVDRESRSKYVLLISATDSGETAGRRHLGLEHFIVLSFTERPNMAAAEAWVKKDMFCNQEVKRRSTS